MQTDQKAMFGNEIEVDGVLYVSVDFLRQYPEYLDSELEELPSIAEMEARGGAVEVVDDIADELSTNRTELNINGLDYIAVPALRANPNYVELKYNQKVDVTMQAFIPKKHLQAEMAAAVSWRRRRSSL